MIYLLLLLLGGQQSKITITVTLDASAKNAKVSIAPLRYDKRFACSFTLDDGLVSAARVALPYFNGGQVAAPFKDKWDFDEGGDGAYHPGLYYTDGCGNALSFKAAVAINARSVSEDNLSWNDLKLITQAGWDVLNHSYTHATGKEVKAAWEVSENTRTVQQRLQTNMQQFVIPGGKDDHLSAPLYANAAFEQGLQVVHSGQYPDYWIEPATRTDWNRLRVGRLFLNSKMGQQVLMDSVFRGIKEHLSTGKYFWLNTFTHSVGNDDLWNISYRFADFTAFFNRLAASYGKEGEDNIWFAPPEAVHAYEAIRRVVKPVVTRSGNKLVITFDKVTLEKYNALTFLVQSSITSVNGTNCAIESYGGKLINITW
ncbi:polysaccharide deacetylase family protein [Chitinophaga sp. SYP-B3965]|uniref:polysaccharide deacetylase family protein n=1 Tax=Chitinophaga sp. SYP-B3965 TaxID=2663120 RepID=UPI0012999F07|nr:polysaccharide deacetylase family protein [Chitinophaga sp. SYP-B3965]MRG45189.1 polysaccharide deacetylase family protein [Chitinophaga sp. SYP-B3965]